MVLGIVFGLGKGGRQVKAVREVDIELRKGETLGIVGKWLWQTTLARCIIKLMESDGGLIVLMVSIFPD